MSGLPAPAGGALPVRSALLDAAGARLALSRVLPMIEPMVRDPSVCGAGFLHIVIMDPGLEAGLQDFEAAILLEHSIGDPADWDADYAAFARDKPRLSWRHRLDGTRVQVERPHALGPGESLLAGGVHLDGITVAASGAMPWYDEAFGLAVAGSLRALAHERHAALLSQGLLRTPGGD